MQTSKMIKVLNINGQPRVNVNPDNVLMTSDGAGGYHLFIAEKGFKSHITDGSVEAFRKLSETISKFKLHVHFKGFNEKTLHLWSEGAVNLTGEEADRVALHVESKKLKTGWTWFPVMASFD